MWMMRRMLMMVCALAAAGGGYAADDTVPAVRIGDDAVPVVDGVLDEAVWERASVVEGFTQVTPVEGAAPSERTVVRVMYSADAVYFGVECFDTAPQEIRASQMRRDAGLNPDDRFTLVIDPYFDRRNGFLFQMNAVGAKVDGLLSDNVRTDLDWDGIWEGKAAITEAGYVLEIAIPYKTISFNPDSDRWGMNFERVIRRKNETVRWRQPLRNSPLRDLSNIGVLEGITEINQGVGLDVKPYGLIRALDNHNTGDHTIQGEAGLDIFYKINPELTFALTYNTDFAETEVDERRINLTRFPLFFPEKRDFFLQDAGIFRFGGIFRNPLPFQSRRIGIGPDGEEREILVGAKLTGRVSTGDDGGGLNIGLIDVQMKHDDELGSKNLAVGRMTYNVGAESTIGIIGTNGDPRSRGSNSVYGADFNYRDSTWFGDKVVEGNLFFLQSKTPGIESGDQSWGFKLRYPNDRISWDIGYGEIQENFNAALGFVPRPGIREYFGGWRYRIRPDRRGAYDIRRFDIGFRGNVTTDLEDVVESGNLELELFEIELNSGDEFFGEYGFQKEVLTSPFEISEGVVLQPGEYRYESATLGFASTQARPLSGFGSVTTGGFFSGDRFAFNVGADYRHSRHLTLGLEYEYNDIDLPEGDFITRLGRARVNIFFTPDLSWTTFAQYDNVSDTVGINSRVRWIIEPGNEMFFVINQGYDVQGTSLHSGFTEVTTKLGWTFRF